MITEKIYLSDVQALAFYQEQATAEFWDKHWKTDQLQTIIRKTTNDKLFIPLVKRYLPKNSTVLEGGCGKGQIVHALQYQGYKAIGVDFASETIKRIKEAVPEIDVRYGDLRKLDLPDSSLDGYISAGVIEHFWDGYQQIIGEMHRTLRIGGYLFVSFPYLSPLRWIKIHLKIYPVAQKKNLDGKANTFYQFALSPRCVRTDLERLGFELKKYHTFDGIKGFKDEISLLRPWLQEIYDGKCHRQLRPYLDKLFKPFASHIAILSMQKVR